MVDHEAPVVDHRNPMVDHSGTWSTMKLAMVDHGRVWVKRGFRGKKWRHTKLPVKP